MSAKTTVGLTAWLALLVIGAVVPLLLLAGVTLFEISKNSQEFIDQGLADTTRALALAVDGEIRSWKASLNALAASRSLQPRRLAEFYDEAREAAAQHEGWIVLTDAGGRQVLNTLRPHGTPLPPQSSLEAVGDTLKDGKPVVSDIFIGKVSQRFVVAVTVPVVRGGSVIYALTLTVGPERLNRLLQDQQIPPSWVGAINDRQRKVVARSRDAESRIGKPMVEWYAAATRAADSGIVTGPRIDGRMSRYAFQRLQEVPWIVGIAVPTSELQSATPIWRFVFVGLTLGLAALGAAVFIGRKITGPVARLATAGGPLVRGEDVDLGPSSGIRQVRELQQAVIEASESIQARYRERAQAEETLRQANEALEVRVQERTRDLARANEALQTANAALQEDIRQRELAEQALRESREDLNRAQAVAQTGSWRLDTQRNELRWSDETYRMFGISPGVPLTYETFLGAIHPEDRQQVDEKWTAALRGAPYDLEHRIVVGDTVKWVRERAELEFDTDGALLGGFGTVQDITERKRAEEEIRSVAKFPDENPYPVLRINRAGRILYSNQTSEPILRLWNRRVGQDLPEAWRARVGEVYDVAQPQELEMECGDRTFSLIFTPVVDAGYVNIYGREVTLRKRAEKEIQRLNAELQQRLVALEEANAELESFSYSVSHDLRAPLRAMNGFSRILVEEHGPKLPPEVQHYLKLIRDNTVQMGRLVDDLLTFSRLSRQPLQRHTVNLAPLVHGIFDSLQPERGGRKVELVVGNLPPCEGDPALLKQVLVNLLDNALKFTRGRAPARIEVGCQVQAEVPVYFIRDNGVGFDMLYSDKLFGVFQRLHRAEEYEGTGVGLAIVQRIIQRHGGRVCAEGEVGKGATFYFTVSGWPPTFGWRE